MDASAVVPGIWVLQHFNCWVDRKAWAVKYLTRKGSVQQPAAVLYVKMLHVLCNSGVWDGKLGEATSTAHLFQ